MDINASVQQISPEQLDAMFEGSAPSATPNADDLVIGKETVVNNGGTSINSSIPNIDLDNLEGLDTPQDEPVMNQRRT
jgi:hypothetical protein